MRPKILLSTHHKTEYYANAVQLCGGIPDAKYCPDVSDKYDGLILCGGEDIHPKYYGEPVNGAVHINEQRDIAELALIEAFISAQKPILGICRGSQLLNVALGGSLCQDLPNKELHAPKNDSDSFHTVTTVKDSLFYSMYGEKFGVNSAHHQAVDQLGKSLIPIAFSENIIEGFIHSKLPILGVQWHPERVHLLQEKTQVADGLKIFQYFIQLCKASCKTPNKQE